SVVSRASSSATYRLPGFDFALSIWSYSRAKLMLNDFAVGPLDFDLMNSAFDAKPEGGSAPIRFVASITVLPSIPCRFSSASATAPPGTATSTASASDTSPPSLPILVTSCPAFSHRSASPPPTLPRPTTAIFIPALLCLASMTLCLRGRRRRRGAQPNLRGVRRDRPAAGRRRRGRPAPSPRRARARPRAKHACNTDAESILLRAERVARWG